MCVSVGLFNRALCAHSVMMIYRGTYTSDSVLVGMVGGVSRLSYASAILVYIYVRLSCDDYYVCEKGVNTCGLECGTRVCGAQTFLQRYKICFRTDRQARQAFLPTMAKSDVLYMNNCLASQN